MSEKSFSPAFYYALHALKHMDDAGYTIVPKSPDPKILTHASQKNAVGVDQVRGIYQSIIDVCHLSPGANFTQGNDLNTPDDDES